MYKFHWKITAAALALILCSLIPMRIAGQQQSKTEISERIRALEKAIQDSPENTDNYLRIEKLYLEENRFDDATRMLDKIIAMQPDNPAAHSEYGYILDITGKHEEALKRHLKSVEIDPNYPLGYLNLGLSYFYTGELEKSHESFERSLATNLKLLDAAKNWPAYTPEEILVNVSEQVFLMTNISFCYLFTDRPYKALAYLELAQGFAPEDPNIAALIFKAREAIGKTGGAGNMGSVDMSKLVSARNAITAGSPSEAIGIYTKLLADGFESHEVYVNLGKAYDMIGDIENSYNSYLKATLINPENPIGFYNLGMLYLKKGNALDAYKAIQRSVELNPSYTVALIVLGKLEMERSLFDNAELHLARAIALSPKSPEARELLCLLYINTSRPDRAIATGREWQKVAASQSEAAACIASALNLAGNNAEALSVISQALENDKENKKLLSLQSALSPEIKTPAKKPPVAAAAVPIKTKKNQAALKKESKNAKAIRKPAKKDVVKEILQVTEYSPVAYGTVNFKKTNPPQVKTKTAKKPTDAKKAKGGVKQILTAADMPPSFATVTFVKKKSDKETAAVAKTEAKTKKPINKPPTIASAKLDTKKVNKDIGAILPAKGPVPIPPAMTDEISRQIESLGEGYLLARTPPAFPYDESALLKLRSEIRGRWLYQDNNNLIWLRNATGGPATKIAPGMQPSYNQTIKSIVYISRQGMERFVSIFDLSTMKSRKVISSNRFARSQQKVFFSVPKISPDGRMVSALVDKGDGRYEVLIINLQTGTILTPMPGYEVSSYSWSADSLKIYFSSTPCGNDMKGNPSCVGELTISSGNTRWINASYPSPDDNGLVGIGRFNAPVISFSPSGRYLLFYDTGIGSGGGIIILDTMEKSAIVRKPSDLVGKNISFYGITWGFDEKSLIFSDEDGTVWRMNPDGSGAFPAAIFHSGAVPPVYLIK